MKINLEPIDFLEYSDLSQVPEVPGVYVWYGFPDIGAADWTEKLNSLGIDECDENFRHLIAKFTQQFSPPPLKVSAFHAFRDGWTGNLEPSSYLTNTTSLKNVDEDIKDSNSYPGESIRSVFACEKTRRVLANALTPECHLMWAPIYIGSAKNLRKRLGQHLDFFKKSIDRHHIKKRDREETIRELEEQEKKLDPSTQDSMRVTVGLAARLFRFGFDLEQIRISYLHFEGADLTEQQKIATARSYEWLLNTWNKPILGRV